MAASCGPRLSSIVFVLLLLVLQADALIRVHQRSCSSYMGSINALKDDAVQIGKAGGQAIGIWEQKYEFSRNVDSDERKRIQTPLETLLANMEVPLWADVSDDDYERIEQVERWLGTARGMGAESHSASRGPRCMHFQVHTNNS